MQFIQSKLLWKFGDFEKDIKYYLIILEAKTIQTYESAFYNWYYIKGVLIAYPHSIFRYSSNSTRVLYTKETRLVVCDWRVEFVTPTQNRTFKTLAEVIQTGVLVGEFFTDSNKNSICLQKSLLIVSTEFSTPFALCFFHFSMENNTKNITYLLETKIVTT